MTIKDIAKHAGVSPSTVSSVLNGKGNFSAATIKRVWNSANELDYTPNQHARRLRARTEGERPRTDIVLHVSHLGQESPVGDSFQSWRSTLLNWEAKKVGLFTTTYFYFGEEHFACPPLVNGCIDGAIVGTPHLSVVEILRRKVPVVLMDVPFMPGQVDTPMVNVDLRHGFFQILKRLRELGHRRIGIYSWEGLQDARRYSAMVEAAAVNGVEIHPDFLGRGPISPETHDSVMRDFAAFTRKHVDNRQITALVCSGDVYAESLASIFRETGINIPGDLSITGFGGYSLSTPTVTTVCYDWPAMVEVTLQVLNDVISGTRRVPAETLVKPIFVDAPTMAEPS